MLLEFVQGGELFSVVHTGGDDDPMTPLSCPCPYILALAHASIVSVTTLVLEHID